MNEDIKFVVNGHGTVWDSYKSGPSPMMSLDYDKETHTVKIEFDGVYICRHRPWGFRFRMFLIRLKWKLRKVRYAIQKRKTAKIYVRSSPSHRKAVG